MTSQLKYQNIVESSLDGIVIVQQGRLVYVNPAAVQIFGYHSAEEMKIIKFMDIVAPASRPFLFDNHEQWIDTDIFRNYELKGLTKQGKIIDLEANAKVIEWNEQPAVVASLRDITERKILERDQALWLWEQETLTKIDRQLVAMVDLQKVLEAISHHAKALTGADFAGIFMADLNTGYYQWEALKGNTLPLPTHSFQLTPLHRELLQSMEPIILQNFGEIPSLPAEQFPVLQAEKLISIAGFSLRVKENLEGMLVTGYRNRHQFSDRELRQLISLAEKSSIAVANAKLYENLRQHQKRLELLSGARVQAQEEERRRIAREIHDGLGQMLTAIKFNLEVLEDSFSPQDEEYKRIEDMKYLLDNVMKEAREISYNLLPSVLDDFGLAPALQLLCDRFSKRRDIKVNFISHGPAERLDSKIEIGLYRIAQEAFNNISKHAGAKEVNFQIVRHRDGLRLTIEDDGKGFTAPLNGLNTERKGMGLAGMKERVVSFNGTFTIDSSPGKGTLINVEIPLTEPVHHGENPDTAG